MCGSVRLALFFLLYAASAGICISQHAVHPQAHAHNDYEHDRPLLDAYTNGFTSVEADVHLRQGKLLIGHESVQADAPDLAKLYLRPLDSLLKITGNRIFADSNVKFCLMLDLKTDGVATLEAIEKELMNFTGLKASDAIDFLISGQVPKAEMLAGRFEGFKIDGRPEDLGKSIPTSRMPRISTRFGNIARTSRDGKIRAESLEKISQLAQQVHQEGKSLRLWAIPDNSLAWEQLLNAGVDILNSDQLEALNLFLTEQHK
jgi:hypothetical protein